MSADSTTVLAATACKDTAITLERAFDDAGIALELALTGKEARERIFKNSISLVLVDLSLKGGGVALARYANSIHSHIPVVVMLDPEKRQSPQGYPALSKPIDAAEVVTMVQQQLEAHHTASEVESLRRDMTDGFSKVFTMMTELHPVKVLWETAKNWKFWSALLPVLGIVWWLVEDTTRDYLKALKAVPKFQEQVIEQEALTREVLSEQKALRRELPFLLRGAPVPRPSAP